jgi:hypothetical protein
MIRPETYSNTTRRALSNGVFRFSAAPTMIKKLFFKITAASSRVQLIEGSTIFSATINVSSTKTVNFESKLTLSSDESVQQFRERRSIHSFLSKNDFRLS